MISKSLEKFEKHSWFSLKIEVFIKQGVREVFSKISHVLTPRGYYGNDKKRRGPCPYESVAKKILACL
jgi:hypothetical protein